MVSNQLWPLRQQEGVRKENLLDWGDSREEGKQNCPYNLKLLVIEFLFHESGWRRKRIIVIEIHSGLHNKTFRNRSGEALSVGGMGQKDSLALECSNMTGCLLGFMKNCTVCIISLVLTTPA